MEVGGPRKVSAAFVSVFAFDVLAVAALALLFVRRVLPLYPEAPIAYLTLFAVNVLVLRVVGARRAASQTIDVEQRIATSLWIVAAIFTPSGAAAIIAGLMHPTLPLVIQAFVAILGVSYIWFLIRRARNRKHLHDPRVTSPPRS